MNIKDNWKAFLTKRTNAYLLIITLIVWIACVYFLSRFIIFVESRSGVVLNDPFFNRFSAVELNIPVFTLIYGSLITCIVYLIINYPARFVVALQAYTLLVIVRIAMMYVTPLDPPAGTIDLQDPLVFIVGTGTKITRDLFFSGHTSTLFMLFLVTVNRKLKYTFLVNTVLVGLFVILQKAHYTVDVLAAPFVSYSVYKIVFYLNEKYFQKNNSLS
ncbi:MAG: phosphatase PAP2-related protein [Ignavibacteria bacterium]|nr:phosphatase PAP2-related protein [Ignavibacteria bacterium]